MLRSSSTRWWASRFCGCVPRACGSASRQRGLRTRRSSQIGQNHHWARAANRVCAREHARLVALPAGKFSAIETQERTNAIEQDALEGLRRLDSRTRLQKNFIAWREYEVKLDVWVLEQLELGDDAAVALGIQRIRSAREYSRRLARRLSAKTCGG